MDLHGLLFLAAVVFVPFQAHVVVVSDLYDFAHWHFHSGRGLYFTRVGETLGRGIVRAFGKLDSSAHVVDP